VTELEQAIQAIEHGLLKVTRSSKHPAKKMELIQRMTYYKVPGISVAFVNQEELAWAKGFGVVEADSEKPVTNGENGRHLGWEVSRGLAEIVKWSWW
jgi:hypothetical protein